MAWAAKTGLNWPRLLHGLNISSSSDGVDVEIEKDGRTRSFHMTPSVSIGAWFSDSIPAGWVDARPQNIRVPVSHQHEDSHYWFTVLPEQRAIYFQFNLVINDGEPLDKFAARLSTALNRQGIDRVVIDLRNNTGGDNTLLQPLLVALIRAPQNRRGGMFAIIGPTTFSAAQNFVNRLESYSDVILLANQRGRTSTFMVIRQPLHCRTAASLPQRPSFGGRTKIRVMGERPRSRRWRLNQASMTMCQASTRHWNTP